MTTNDLTVLIPAIKKTVAFQDDLVKKLDGISLIQRAINKAIELDVSKSDIYILTDSEEIQLIAERNRVQVYFDSDFVWNEEFIEEVIIVYLQQLVHQDRFILFLSVYAPLISIKLINNARKKLADSNMDILQPVKQVKKHLYDENNKITYLELFGGTYENHTIESKAFMLLHSNVLEKKTKQQLSVLPWLVDYDIFEIESFQDWWVCEKLLHRKRIVFRVIGNNKIGMGNIYRALAVAHEITDHEILFVSDTNNQVAVNKLASYDYWLEIYKPNEIVQKIIELSPDLVINDILSTSEEDVKPLLDKGIKVVNFEDIGEGALKADLVINELYDTPEFDGGNILWGHDYFFVREEFMILQNRLILFC